MRRFLRPSVLVPVGLAAAIVFGVGLYLFQPWKLFTTTEVNEAAPISATDLGIDVATPEPTRSAAASSAAATPPPESASPSPSPEPAEPIVVAEGTFISHEHATSGSVVILELADGTRVLRLEDLQTSDGPDLQVWLSDQPVIDGVAGWGVFDDGAYTNLGALKGNVGNQNYRIPADVDLGDFSSISVWCARFSVSFGAAELVPVA